MCWHPGARLAIYLKEVLDHFKGTDSAELRIMTDNVSSDNSITRELQSTHEASGIEWPALMNHIPYMVHVILIDLGVFMRSFGVTGHTKSWEAHVHN